MTPTLFSLPFALRRALSRLWKTYGQPYTQGASLRMLLLGFAAGLPFLLVMSTLSFWLRRAGIDRSTIGQLSWIGLIYALKWVWAPLVDQWSIPGLTRRWGQRRAFLFVGQLTVMGGLAGLSFCDPAQSLPMLVGFALLVAWGSATQDIALDAFRIEQGHATEQATLAATYQAGYRLATLWASAGTLFIVAYLQSTGDASASVTQLAHPYKPHAWQTAYACMAACMGVGLLTTWLSPPALHSPIPTGETSRNTPGDSHHFFHPWAWAGHVHRHLRACFWQPLQQFIVQQRAAWWMVLVLVATYRISDIVMGVMASPFYADMGYTEQEVASVTKVYGLVMTLLGGLVGGGLVRRWGLMPVMLVGLVLSALTNLLFGVLSLVGHNLNGLMGVVSADNFASGLASCAFVAYLSSLTQRQYSATQYAWLSSLMVLLPKSLAGFSGIWVNHWGYRTFFTFTASLSLPVLGCLIAVWMKSTKISGESLNDDER
jgi:PAT family beta-lactamase induction signal transducer AmpG